MGYYDVGIPPSGALDLFSLTAANLLVGNEEGAAALELAYSGRSCASGDAIVAVAGAELAPRVDGEDRPLWEAFEVPAGAMLSFAHLRGGARAYVAVAGGIDVPELLGSRSTYALGSLGGFRAGRWPPATRCQSAGRRAGAGDGPGGAAPVLCHRARDPRRDGALRPSADRRWRRRSRDRRGR